MPWLSIFPGMQTWHRLPSNNILVNYDLHKQDVFFLHAQVLLQVIITKKHQKYLNVLGHRDSPQKAESSAFRFGTILPSTVF